MPASALTREPDGCYHPSSEAELAQLVRLAAEAGAQLRVMGSTHSVWRAIVTDHFDGPSTPANEFAVVLDRESRKERVDALAKTLERPLAKETAYKIALAVGMCDFSSSSAEGDFEEELLDALGIDDDEADRLAAQVYDAIGADEDEDDLDEDDEDDEDDDEEDEEDEDDEAAEDA